MHLGFGHGDVAIEKAWMCKEVEKNILWIRLKEEEGVNYVKKVKTRAATKRPNGFSVRDYCPNIAMERKKEDKRSNEREEGCCT